ncbi:MAG: hypothetical protein GXY36_05150 [Chloroflexi bacterium]|nr:hypothetical protein [Chloroflexota bacterium]
MEKVIQEFRIIETDDGFRIEIKGDKEQLRDFVMNLDPRQWGRRGHWAPWGEHPHGRHGRHGHGFRFGPMGGWFGFGGPWDWGEEDDEDAPPRKRKPQGGGTV